MKIIIIGKFGPEELGKHLSETLFYMGHKVKEIEFGPYINEIKVNKNSIIRKIKNNLFNIGLFINSKIRKIILRKIMKEIQEENEADLLITTYDYLSNAEIKKIKIKNPNMKIVMYFPDGLVNIKRALFLTAGYDALFFKCNHIVTQLKDIYELPAYYLPECFNPNKHKKIELTSEERKKYLCDLLFVGTLHSCRVPIIEKLLQLNKYNIKIYGSPPPFYIPISKELRAAYTNKYAANEEKSKIVKAAKININTLHLGEATGANVRTFEIAGIGGFQIATYKKEMEELFVIDKEIVTFKTFTELVEKIDYYLNNENKRHEIMEAGYKRAIKEHYYEKRLNQILEIIKNKNERRENGKII